MAEIRETLPAEIVEVGLGAPPDIIEVGTQGPAGVDGNTVLSGVGVPGVGVGIDGDFYIDTTPPQTIYGPKTGGVWGSGTPFLPSDYVTSTTVREIVALTRAAYDAIAVPDPEIMYAIIP